MSEEDPKFERKEYGELAEGQSSADYTTAVNDLRVSPQCSHDACTNSTEDPAEPAWVKLMSAVPQANQITSLKASREGTMLLPEGQTIQSMVASIRPQPEADYALDTIRDEWIDFREDFLTIAPKLEQGLSTLSGFWKGEDFDAFEEQTETVLKNCRTIAGDIAGENGDDGVVKLIDDKQLEIYEQQGGTSCPYPAPKFYMQGTSCGSHQIHIRPPFFKNCEIHKNDEIKKAVELAGFDPTIMDEVQEGRETTYNRWLEYVNANPDYEEGGVKGEALATKKADEFADRRLVTLGAQGSEQLEEESARVNEEVTERHANAEAHVQEITPDVRKGEGTTFDNGDTPKFDSGGLDGGDGGGMPDIDEAGGIDSLQTPQDLRPVTGGPDTSGLNANGLNGGPNGGPNSQTPAFANSGGNLDGLNGDNAFGSNMPDPDNVNGSLTAPNGSELPPGGDYSGGGLNGTPPGGNYPGSDLSSLDDNPWNAGADPDDVTGGLAGGGGLGGGGGSVPGNISTGGLSNGGLGGGNPPSGYVPGGGLGGGGTTPRRVGGTTGLNTGPRKLGGTSGDTGPRKIGGRTPSFPGGGGGGGTGSIKGGGLGGPPGSSGKGGSLGGMSGGGSGAGGAGSGGGRGGGVGGAGAGAGGAGAAGAKGGLAGGAHGAGGMIGGGAPGGRRDEDGESERQFWIAEDEDVWGGGPEDEEEDPYA
ncbi:hypothetical protein [Glycomyces harbinensis]|uniref:Uncharacterized protein n=1 Tax=Glycomyces harbinensis TaxID=58114 RepID=A0A1G6UDI4_9ACTN|nr:hypothetical protein [Glycomyces harbinensis]SDD39311.1 hypothetical protein SAMN05216270_103436 [Glycomyces harbinensis]